MIARGGAPSAPAYRDLVQGDWIERSQEDAARHAALCSGLAALQAPLGFGWFLEPPRGVRDTESSRLDRALSLVTGRALALWSMPAAIQGLSWDRDAFGKPRARWQGHALAWAREQGVEPKRFHLASSHDGGVRVVLAAYSARLAGLGIDIVHLPRLCGPGKDATYLHRLASRFMSLRERTHFDRASRGESPSQLALRVAIHFSLMEAASKALGVGLRLGAGLGARSPVAKEEIDVIRVGPPVRLSCSGAALRQQCRLRARSWQAFWSADAEYLMSVVALWG